MNFKVQLLSLLYLVQLIYVLSFSALAVTSLSIYGLHYPPVHRLVPPPLAKKNQINFTILLCFAFWFLYFTLLYFKKILYSSKRILQENTLLYFTVLREFYKKVFGTYSMRCLTGHFNHDHCFSYHPLCSPVLFIPPFLPEGNYWLLLPFCLPIGISIPF